MSWLDVEVRTWASCCGSQAHHAFGRSVSAGGTVREGCRTFKDGASLEEVSH